MFSPGEEVRKSLLNESHKDKTHWCVTGVRLMLLIIKFCSADDEFSAEITMTLLIVSEDLHWQCWHWGGRWYWSLSWGQICYDEEDSVLSSHSCQDYHKAPLIMNSNPPGTRNWQTMHIWRINLFVRVPTLILCCGPVSADAGAEVRCESDSGSDTRLSSRRQHLDTTIRWKICFNWNFENILLSVEIIKSRAPYPRNNILFAECDFMYFWNMKHTFMTKLWNIFWINSELILELMRSLFTSKT